MARWALVLALAASSTADAQRVIYVDTDATGANDGSSWPDAFVFLQDALALAQDGDEVWMAEGIYRPDRGRGIEPGNRDTSFVIAPGLSLYGGFSGVEMTRGGRDWAAHPTVLSGDLLGNDGAQSYPPGPDRADNSEHVVLVPSSTPIGEVRFDGLVISGGNSQEYGGGIFLPKLTNLHLHHMMLTENYACWGGAALVSFGTFVLEHSVVTANFAGPQRSCGGAGSAVQHWTDTYADELPAPPRLDHVLFDSNVGANSGGALAALGGPIVVTNSSFVNNRSSSEGGAVYHGWGFLQPPSVYQNVSFIGNVAPQTTGGAISMDGSPVVVVNALFDGNVVEPSADPTRAGGAIAVYEEESTLIVVNSTFVNNRAPQGGAIWRGRSGITETIQIWNSIFWNNDSEDGLPLRNDSSIPILIGYSIIEGGLPSGSRDAGGNLRSDPLFVNPTGDDGVTGTPDDDYSLAAGSPGIDAGDSGRLPQDAYDLDGDGDTAETIPLDLRGNRRLADGGAGEVRVDIGPYEFVATSNGTESGNEALGPRPACSGAEVFPNPTTAKVTLRLPASLSAGVQVDVFDLLGRRTRKRSIITRAHGPVSNLIQLDLSELPAGLYVIALSSPRSGSACSKAVALQRSY